MVGCKRGESLAEGENHTYSRRQTTNCYKYTYLWSINDVFIDEYFVVIVDWSLAVIFLSWLLRIFHNALALQDVLKLVKLKKVSQSKVAGSIEGIM